MLFNAGPANIFESPESRPCLKVICRKYSPIPGTRCSKSWTKGTEKIDIHLPTFAIRERQYAETVKCLDDLLDAGYEKLVTELAIGQDEIVSWTLEEAVRQAKTVSTWPGRSINIAD